MKGFQKAMLEAPAIKAGPAGMTYERWVRYNCLECKQFLVKEYKKYLRKK